MKSSLKLIADGLRDVSEKCRRFAEDDSEGVWRTVRGRKIFIKKGESLDAALARNKLPVGNDDDDLVLLGSMYGKTPPFVHDVMARFTSMNKLDAYLMTLDRSKLQKALDLTKSHLDAPTRYVRERMQKALNNKGAP